jgi:hypothetical protein
MAIIAVNRRKIESKIVAIVSKKWTSCIPFWLVGILLPLGQHDAIALDGDECHL